MNLSITKFDEIDLKQYIRDLVLSKSDKKSRCRITIERKVTYNKMLSKLNIPTVIIKHILTFLDDLRNIELDSISNTEISRYDIEKHKIKIININICVSDPSDPQNRIHNKIEISLRQFLKEYDLIKYSARCKYIEYTGKLKLTPIVYFIREGQGRLKYIFGQTDPSFYFHCISFIIHNIQHVFDKIVKENSTFGGEYVI